MGNSKKLYEDEDSYANICVAHGAFSDSTTQELTSATVPWVMCFDTIEDEEGVTLGTTSEVTISNASPAVISWAAHGLFVDSCITFTTTGALPTGLVAGTRYFIIAAGFGADSFQVSATPQGAAIDTSSAGSGTHTAINKSVINISKAGHYSFIFSSICNATSSTGSAIDIWFRKNGVNVARSNTKVQLPTANSLLISAADVEVSPLVAGDRVEMFWRGSQTDDQLKAIAAAASPDRPATPSTILTVTYKCT